MSGGAGERCSVRVEAGAPFGGAVPEGRGGLGGGTTARSAGFFCLEGVGGGGGLGGGGLAPFGAVAARVEGGAEGGGGWVEVAADVDLVGAGADQVGGEDLAVGVADVGQADGAGQGLAPGAGGDLADGHAVAQD